MSDVFSQSLVNSSPTPSQRPPPDRGLKVVVFGGRDWGTFSDVTRELDRVLAPFHIGLLIHGAADGVDSYAGAWARNRGVMVCWFPAQWEYYERQGRQYKAGPDRNQAMIDWMQPDLAVAFPGGAGTADMFRRVKAARINFIHIGDTPC